MSEELQTRLPEGTTEAILEFQIAQSYFSDILNAQLVIFSLIVAALVGLYFFFSFKVASTQIKNEVEQSVENVKEQIRMELEEGRQKLTKELADKTTALEKKSSEEFAKHEGEIMILRGENYRAFALHWDGQKAFAGAFIWWIRAAHSFASAEDRDMARVSLAAAKESVERVKYGTELQPDIIGEYQRLYAEIDDSTYSIEKELLSSALKESLSRRVTPQS